MESKGRAARFRWHIAGRRQRDRNVGTRLREHGRPILRSFTSRSKRAGVQARDGDKSPRTEPEDVPNSGLLVKAASDAVGDPDRTWPRRNGVHGTHDLLSAKYRDDNDLDTALRDVIHQEFSPTSRLTPAIRGWWLEQGGDLLSIGRGGIAWWRLKQGIRTRQDHVRVIQSLARIGWDTKDAIKPVDDGSQIMFFQEFGGFPRCALQGARNEETYDQHRSQANKAPLHIVTDEMAERYSICSLRSWTCWNGHDWSQAMGIRWASSLRVISRCRTGKAVDRQYAFLRRIQELDENNPYRSVGRLRAVRIKLARAEIAEIIGSIGSVRWVGQVRQIRQVCRPVMASWRSVNHRAASPDTEPQMIQLIKPDRAGVGIHAESTALRLAVEMTYGRCPSGNAETKPLVH